MELVLSSCRTVGTLVLFAGVETWNVIDHWASPPHPKDTDPSCLAVKRTRQISLGMQLCFELRSHAKVVRLWHVAHMTEAVGSTNSVLAGSTLQALHSFNQGFCPY